MVTKPESQKKRDVQNMEAAQVRYLMSLLRLATPDDQRNSQHSKQSENQEYNKYLKAHQKNWLDLLIRKTT
jgi:hypothetical protein